MFLSRLLVPPSSHQLLSSCHNQFLQTAGGLPVVGCFWERFAGTGTLCFSSTSNFPPLQITGHPPPFLCPMPGFLAVFPADGWVVRSVHVSWSAKLPPQQQYGIKYSLGSWWPRHLLSRRSEDLQFLSCEKGKSLLFVVLVKMKHEVIRGYHRTPGYS